jgi:hypothetical protein
MSLHSPEESEMAQVRTLAELSQRYEGVDSPDESVGPETGESFLDYGPPVVLTEVSVRRPSLPGRVLPLRDTRPEDSSAKVKNAFEAPSSRLLFKRMLGRISDSFAGTSWM